MDIFSGPYLPSPPIFFGKNYELWEIKILIDYLWDISLNGFEEPSSQVAYEAMTQGQREKLEENKGYEASLFLIQKGLDERMLPNIVTTTTSKEA